MTSFTAPTLYWRETGQGEPLVLVHGLGVWGYVWRHVVPLLAKHYRVIWPDLPGCGEATVPDPRLFSFHPSVMAEVLLSDLAKQGVRSPKMVGHSFGGAVALEAARLGGAEGVQSLFLIDSAGIPQPIPGYVRPLTWPFFGWLVTFLPPGAGVKQAVAAVYKDPKATLTDEDIAEFERPLRKRIARRALRKTVQSLLPMTRDNSHLEGWKGLSQKISLLWGEEDRVITPEKGQELALTLGASPPILLKNCGHSPPEEKPKETVDALLKAWGSEAPR